MTEEGGKCWKRLIVVTSVDDENDSKSIANWVWEVQNQNDQNNLCHIDLVVLNIVNPANSKHAKKQNRYGSVVSVLLRSATKPCSSLVCSDSETLTKPTKPGSINTLICSST